MRVARSLAVALQLASPEARRIPDTDIVVWPTIGMRRFPRSEDWPVMPTAWHGFELRPFDFFDRNPALDPP